MKNSEKAKEKAEELYEQIAHGDAEHKAWLHAKLKEFFVSSVYPAWECNTCKWYCEEVCTMDESPLCADFVDKDYGCVLYEAQWE